MKTRIKFFKKEEKGYLKPLFDLNDPVKRYVTTDINHKVTAAEFNKWLNDYISNLLIN